MSVWLKEASARVQQKLIKFPKSFYKILRDLERVKFCSNSGVSRHWPPTIQIFGRDIINFHCIYFPAMLLAADLELPKSVLIHGHWSVEGEKMGKSKANFVTFEDMEKTVNGQVDGIRWFFLNHVSQNNTDYSEDLLRIEADSALGIVL